MSLKNETSAGARGFTLKDEAASPPIYSLSTSTNYVSPCARTRGYDLVCAHELNRLTRLCHPHQHALARRCSLDLHVVVGVEVEEAAEVDDVVRAVAQRARAVLLQHLQCRLRSPKKTHTNTPSDTTQKRAASTYLPSASDQVLLERLENTPETRSLKQAWELLRLLQDPEKHPVGQIERGCSLGRRRT
eukprot:227181-Rhodomonas_salina.5